MRALPFIFLVGLSACNKTVPPKTPPTEPRLTAPAPTPAPAASAVQALPPSADAPTAEGEVIYSEKSGNNLYIEIKPSSGGKSIGIELFPNVAPRFAGKIKKGEQIAVWGKRKKGDKEIAYVVDVNDPTKVRVGSEGATAGQLVAIKLPRKTSGPAVEMIAGYGMWAPFDKAEIRQRISKAKKDAVPRLVLDTGLTELYRAYEKPAPFLQVIKQAAAEAKKQKIAIAFYFPSFEIRREKRTRTRTPMGKWRPEWPQHTLSGKPFIKTAFGKQEFWNKAGDEALWACPNSPWRKVFIKQMKEAVKRGATTLFIDVPYFQKSGKHITCRCRYCQARFKKATGQTIPRKVSPGRYAYHRWLAWRHETLSDFFRELRRAIRGVDRSARLVIEEYPAYLAGATTATGVDIGFVGRDDVDLFAHEYSAKQFDKKPFSEKDRLELASTLALYRGLDGAKPTWVLSYAHDVTGSRVNAAFHLAFDATFWETKAPEMNDTTVGGGWRRKLFGWFKKHRGLFGGRQLASVAVLYSPASRDFVPAHFRTLRQVTMALTRSRVPFRVLSTRDLAELGDYSTLVIPAVGAMAGKEAAAIRRFTGQVLVVGPAPTKDALGIKTVGHNIKHKKVSLASLPATIQGIPVRVEGQVVANLVARPGEIQVRLANLGTRATRATVTLLPPKPIARATKLPLLNRETALQTTKLEAPAGAIQFTVQVKDLTIARLRF